MTGRKVFEYRNSTTLTTLRRKGAASLGDGYHPVTRRHIQERRLQHTCSKITHKIRLHEYSPIC